MAINTNSNKWNEIKIQTGVEFILEGLGIDLKDKNFIDTPNRVARLYSELCEGLLSSSKEELEEYLTKTFPSVYKGIVVIKDIETWGICPHHLVQIFYKVSIGYLPRDEMLGISKFPRLVSILSHRPVLQEQLTQDIMDFLKKIRPLGIIVHVIGEHFCIKTRGIKQSNVKMVTTSLTGVFDSDPSAKQEFYNMISSTK